MVLPEIVRSLGEVVIRTTIVYVVVFVLLRIAGKRQLGQLSMLGLVVLLLISNGVQNAMIGDDTSLLAGLVSAITLLAVDRGIDWLASRHPWLNGRLQGEPRELVRNGVVDEVAMKRERIDMDELHAALRANGVEHPEEVRLAMLETNGSISVIPLGSGGGSGAAATAS
ncbi:MAG TPA: YetF domain-containing protein [Candidatus Limnocylindrales bacterium]|jgi:uncharacterized membrane protein YcaP (DUF421 family)